MLEGRLDVRLHGPGSYMETWVRDGDSTTACYRGCVDEESLLLAPRRRPEPRVFRSWLFPGKLCTTPFFARGL